MLKRLLAAIPMFILAFGGGAFAQTQHWCNEYANQAVISAMQNRSYGCGFTGLRWSSSYRVHYSWCITVPQPVSLQERLARQAGIKSCR